MTSMPAQSTHLADAANWASIVCAVPVVHGWLTSPGSTRTLMATGVLGCLALMRWWVHKRKATRELTPAEAAADIQVVTHVFDGLLDGGVHRTALDRRTEDAETREALRRLTDRAKVPKDIFDPALRSTTRRAVERAWACARVLDELDALGPRRFTHWKERMDDPELLGQHQLRRDVEDEARKAMGLLLRDLDTIDRRLHLLGTRAATSR
ncbi:hypothetical protein AAEX63_01750 [Luteococcus sp. H138]|uniref:hypothetical protein n=1 Tax=Luteococcus sp. H138 TaxID=3139404 RepID=UPI00313C8D1C